MYGKKSVRKQRYLSGITVMLTFFLVYKIIFVIQGTSSLSCVIVADIKFN